MTIRIKLINLLQNLDISYYCAIKFVETEILELCISGSAIIFGERKLKLKDD